MHARTLAIATLAAGVAAAVPLKLNRSAPTDEGALGAYLVGERAPDVYVELFDLNELERDLRGSGLARLGSRFLPLIEQHVDDQLIGVVNQQMGIDPGSLLRGELSWEDALAQTLYTLAHEHLGIERDEALRTVAALGSRFSMAADPAGERVAVSWSLRSGGYGALVGSIDRRLGGIGLEWSEDFIELQSIDGDGSGEGKLYGFTIDGDDQAFIALRPDLVAISTDAGWSRHLAFGDAAQGEALGTAPFAAARERALRSGQPVWGWANGELIDAIADEGDDVGDALHALGLTGIGQMDLSLGGDGGQLVSRMRIELDGRGPRGLLGLVRGGRAEWDGLDKLTSDAFLVAGVGRSPGELAREVMAVVGQTMEVDELDDLWQRALDVPLLGELLAPGATGDEAVFFLRPGAAGLPMAYLSMPATDGVLDRLARLETTGGQAERRVQPGSHPILNPGLAGMGRAQLRTKELEGRTCWMLSGHLQGIALTEHDGSLIVSKSFLALQDYMRQRSREDAGDRDQRVDEVRAQVRRAQAATGMPASSLAGFAHVRIEPLAESVWPWVMMGLSMGGAEGLEDLPDAFEIAEEIGDTTLLLFEDGNALELHGRGLFGGLGVLF